MGEMDSLGSHIEAKPESYDSQERRNLMVGILITLAVGIAFWTGVILAFVA